MGRRITKAQRHKHITIRVVWDEEAGEIQEKDALEHEHIEDCGYLKVGTVGRKEERQEGEDENTEDREVSSSRLKNAQNSFGKV